MLDLSGRDVVVVDVETSGVNPFRHEVLAVGLVPMEETSAGLVIYVRPPSIEWSEYARRNFERYADTWEELAISPAEACAAIENYLAATFGGRAVTAVGHNVGFDIAFLRRLAFLGGRDQLAGLSHRAIDTHTLLYTLALWGRIPPSAVTSDGAFKHFGVDVANADRHTALGDALATRELVQRVLVELGADRGAQSERFSLPRS